jgi:hypothetical protein
MWTCNVDLRNVNLCQLCMVRVSQQQLGLQLHPWSVQCRLPTRNQSHFATVVMFCHSLQANIWFVLTSVVRRLPLAARWPCASDVLLWNIGGAAKPPRQRARRGSVKFNYGVLWS